MMKEYIHICNPTVATLTTNPSTTTSTTNPTVATLTTNPSTTTSVTNPTVGTSVTTTPSSGTLLLPHQSALLLLLPSVGTFTTTPSVGTSTTTPNECSNLNEIDCNNNWEFCVYDWENSKCYNKGSDDMPCNLVSEKAFCPTDKCTFSPYSEGDT